MSRSTRKAANRLSCVAQPTCWPAPGPPAILFEFNPITLAQCGEDVDTLAANLTGHILYTSEPKCFHSAKWWRTCGRLVGFAICLRCLGPMRRSAGGRRFPVKCGNGLLSTRDVDGVHPEELETMLRWTALRGRSTSPRRISHQDFATLQFVRLWHKRTIRNVCPFVCFWG